MPTVKSLDRTALSGLCLIILMGAWGSPAAGSSQPNQDPLEAEIAAWSAYLKDNKSTDEMWTQSRDASQPVLDLAVDALRQGRRWLALQRFASARLNLAASRYVIELDAARRKDPAALESEWARVGVTLGGAAGAAPPAPPPTAFESIHPAAVRAVGEASLFQSRVFHEASLIYGRSTEPDSGYYYLGAALAQRDLADLCRRLSTPASGRVPPVRSIASELDALETEILSAYKPPASIDKHREFIIASAALKEARELDAAGFRYGALLRYLQATLRLAPIRTAAPAEPPALAAQLDAFERRLSQNDLDHTIGRIFLDAARADAANAPTIAAEVLPRYFAALEPAAAMPPPPEPQVTVTLVRWPYT